MSTINLPWRRKWIIPTTKKARELKWSLKLGGKRLDKREKERIRKVRQILREQRKMKLFILNTREELESEYLQGSKLTASYGERTSPSTADKLHFGAILAFDDDFQNIKRRLNLAMIQTQKVERAIEELSGIEKKIIKIRYLDKYKGSWVKVSMEIGYERASCFNMELSALRKIAFIIFGKEEMEKD